MKVLFLLSDHLAADIEEARKEILEVRDGEAELCVVARSTVDCEVLERVIADYCISCMYVIGEAVCWRVNDNGVPAKYFDRDGILNPSDRIFARRASREGRELIEIILGNRECDIRLTVG